MVLDTDPSKVVQTENEMKHFEHDCEHCTFHGHMQGYDVYTCVSSVVLRFGSDGPEYKSMPKDLARDVAARDGGLWKDAFELINKD